jgi:GntR family transcriptional regulator
MSFPLIVDLDDAVPIYAQLERQLRALLARGFWAPGERLPSVRETATRLAIHPLTVAKAFRILQDEGLLESRPGAGVYAGEAARLPKTRRREAVRDLLEQAVIQAGANGLTREELEDLLAEALRKHRQRLKW